MFAQKNISLLFVYFIGSVAI